MGERKGLPAAIPGGRLESSNGAALCALFFMAVRASKRACQTAWDCLRRSWVGASKQNKCWRYAPCILHLSGLASELATFPNEKCSLSGALVLFCGERGIRTPGAVTHTSHFECDPFNQLWHLSWKPFSGYRGANIGKKNISARQAYFLFRRTRITAPTSNINPGIIYTSRYHSPLAPFSLMVSILSCACFRIVYPPARFHRHRCPAPGYSPLPNVGESPGYRSTHKTLRGKLVHLPATKTAHNRNMAGRVFDVRVLQAK